MSSNNGPVHVLMALMAPSSADTKSEGGQQQQQQQQQQQRQWELNPRLQRGYIAQRTKAYDLSVKQPLHVWTGVSNTEYALVCCCEDHDGAPADEAAPTAAAAAATTNAMGRKWTREYPLVGGGTLDVGQELRFLGILAKDCSSMATRALALAILERTLDTHLWELEEAEQRRRPDQADDSGENQQEDDAVNEEQEDEEDDEEAEEEEDSSEPGQKRRSRRLRKQQPKYKRTKRKEEKQQSNSKQENAKFDYENWSRLEQFFAAGGLRILNRWLVEASEDEPVPAARPTSNLPPSTNSGPRKARSSTRKEEEPTTRPSSTRPLILPILRFLERIPFDKTLVLASKINKQIRKIEKQVDKTLQTQRQGKHSPEDLQNWTTESTISDTDALDYIKEAVENVKKAWGEKTKKEKEQFGNPFEELTETLKERLSEVTAFERGSAPRPDWMELPEEKKESKAKKSRSELAAKERQAELEIRKGLDEDLKRRLREAEKKSREHLLHLREMRKTQEANSPSLTNKKTSGGKEVQWKDGMKSKVVRNRKELEEIFVFNKHTPANRDFIDAGEFEERDATPETIATSPDNPDMEDSGISDMETDDMFDFSLV